MLAGFASKFAIVDESAAATAKMAKDALHRLKHNGEICESEDESNFSTKIAWIQSRTQMIALDVLCDTDDDRYSITC